MRRPSRCPFHKVCLPAVKPVSSGLSQNSSASATDLGIGSYPFGESSLNLAQPLILWLLECLGRARINSSVPIGGAHTAGTRSSHTSADLSTLLPVPEEKPTDPLVSRTIGHLGNEAPVVQAGRPFQSVPRSHSALGFACCLPVLAHGVHRLQSLASLAVDIPNQWPGRRLPLAIPSRPAVSDPWPSEECGAAQTPFQCEAALTRQHSY